MLFFKKSPAPDRPHPDWPWTLSEGGNITSNFTWDTIEQALARLYPDSDSFLILEQKNPRSGKEYWYLQSALALQGPDAGRYVVGCGYPGENGPVLLERLYDGLDEVTALFAAAFRYQPLDLSGYENFF